MSAKTWSVVNKLSEVTATVTSNLPTKLKKRHSVLVLISVPCNSP
jgi:hypothetical protein